MIVFVVRIKKIVFSALLHFESKKNVDFLIIKKKIIKKKSYGKKRCYVFKLFVIKIVINFSKILYTHLHTELCIYIS